MLYQAHDGMDADIAECFGQPFHDVNMDTDNDDNWDADIVSCFGSAFDEPQWTQPEPDSTFDLFDEPQLTPKRSCNQDKQIS